MVFLLIASAALTLGALRVAGNLSSRADESEHSVRANAKAVSNLKAVSSPMPWQAKLGSLASAARLDVARAVLAGTFDDPGMATPTTVYRVPAAAAKECLVVLGVSTGASCLDGTLLRDRHIAFLVGFSARQTPEDLVHQQVAGLADETVERLVAVYTDGTAKNVPLLPTGAFLHTVTARDLARGAKLSVLLGYDDAGEIVARERL